MANKILVLDDDIEMGRLVQDYFKNEDVEVMCEVDPLKALAILDEHIFDCILTDVKMPKMDGIEFSKIVKEKFTDLPIIIMTAFGSMELAIKAIQVGAYDFITKPIEMDVLKIAINRGLENRNLKKQLTKISKQLERFTSYDNILGQSRAMQNVFSQLEKIGVADISVLVTGETGTGKELVARALHQQGPRPDGPFVAINCAALPENLLESELFGHVKGAFTGAEKERRGLLLEATGGTLFLDEIGDLPLELQSKLLRVLEDRKIRHVGSDKEIPVNFRLISATSRDLETMMEDRDFREDLFFRISTMNIELPPLRQRDNDILLLAQHFLVKSAEHLNKDMKGINSNAAKYLLKYPWKGNVRELKNIIERSVLLANSNEITVDILPEKIAQFKKVYSETSIFSDDPNDLITFEELEKKYIDHALKVLDGNRTKVAKALNIDRKTLYRKLNPS